MTTKKNFFRIFTLLMTFGAFPLLQPNAHSDDSASIFHVEVYIDENLQTSYQFVISPEGLLCPQRRGPSGGTYEYFSTLPSNRGCMSVSQFIDTTHAVAEFRSENNPAVPGRAQEVAGKRFRLTADRIGDATIFPDHSFLGADLSLMLTGKTYTMKAGMQVWAQGDYQLNIRFQRDSNGVWSVLRTGVPFTLVQVYLKAPSEIGIGFGRIIGSTGTFNHPIQIAATPDEIFYR